MLLFVNTVNDWTTAGNAWRASGVTSGMPTASLVGGSPFAVCTRRPVGGRRGSGGARRPARNSGTLPCGKCCSSRSAPGPRAPDTGTRAATLPARKREREKLHINNCVTGLGTKGFTRVSQHLPTFYGNSP